MMKSFVLAQAAGLFVCNVGPNALTAVQGSLRQIPLEFDYLGYNLDLEGQNRRRIDRVAALLCSSVRDTILPPAQEPLSPLASLTSSIIQVKFSLKNGTTSGGYKLFSLWPPSVFPVLQYDISGAVSVIVSKSSWRLVSASAVPFVGLTPEAAEDESAKNECVPTRCRSWYQCSGFASALREGAPRKRKTVKEPPLGMASLCCHSNS